MRDATVFGFRKEVVCEQPRARLAFPIPIAFRNRPTPHGIDHEGMRIHSNKPARQNTISISLWGMALPRQAQLVLDPLIG